MTDERDDRLKQPYEVGYGRPPERTRFQPGRSGNPKGRPKGSKNFSTLLDEELAMPVTLTENGKRKRMPKKQALIKQQVAKALGNDPKAAVLLFECMRRAEGVIDISTVPDFSRLQNPLVLESMIQRLRLNIASSEKTDLTAEEPT